jgi:hypothetical protein
MASSRELTCLLYTESATIKPPIPRANLNGAVPIAHSVHVKSAKNLHMHAFMLTSMRPRTSNSLETQLLGEGKTDMTQSGCCEEGPEHGSCVYPVYVMFAARWDSGGGRDGGEVRGGCVGFVM